MPTKATDYQIVEGDEAYAEGGQAATSEARCPKGWVATGGGYTLSDSALAVACEPSSDGLGWVAKLFNDNDTTVGVKAYVVCHRGTTSYPG